MPRTVCLVAGLALTLLGCGGRLAMVEMAAAARSPEASWSYLGTALEESAAIVEATAQDDLERREGYRMLARSLALGFDRFLEADPANPQLYRLQSATRKFAGDNPDQLYHAAEIDGVHTYRVRGRLRGEGVATPLIEATVYGGGLSFDDPDARRRLIGHLDERTLGVDADGRFEIVLSPEPHEGNWIQTDEDAQSFLVRRYFATPQLEDPLPLTIELEGPRSRAPLDQRQLAKGLIGAGAFVRETVKIWGGWLSGVRARTGPNQLAPMPDDGDLLTPAGMTYLEGAWEIGADEALVLDFTPPDVPYWGFLPMNLWMESFDWRVAPVSINSFGATRNPDGSVTIVMSEADPGHPNWIATLGHRRGLMSMRIARLGEEPLPEVKVRRIAVSELGG